MKMSGTAVSDFNKSELKLCRAKDFFPTQKSECCVTERYFIIMTDLVVRLQCTAIQFKIKS